MPPSSLPSPSSLKDSPPTVTPLQQSRRRGGAAAAAGGTLRCSCFSRSLSDCGVADPDWRPSTSLRGTRRQTNRRGTPRGSVIGAPVIGGAPWVVDAGQLLRANVPCATCSVRRAVNLIRRTCSMRRARCDVLDAVGLAGSAIYRGAAAQAVARHLSSPPLSLSPVLSALSSTSFPPAAVCGRTSSD